MTALVVAMLGTDHHPFPRVVDWIDSVALRLGPETRFVVQHGASPAPLVAEGRDFFPHSEIKDLLARADAVVCHGGPGTIMDARNAGHVPVCVPRDPALGEHVDHHQQRFAELVDRAGVVTRARSRGEFVCAVEDALRDSIARASSRLDSRAADLQAAATEGSCRRLGRELDRLCGARPTRRSSVRRAFSSRVIR